MVHSNQFGKYEIVRKLSRSLTDVYLARDTVADRRVVLKLIEHLRDDFTKLVIEAERRGASIQRQLHQTDPRILEVFDWGEEQNCFFVSMEYFEGKTLAEILSDERRLAPKRAARYAAEVCSQLRVLHSFVSDLEGRKTAVVHGDIKPSNIQIGAHDQLRLLDFGIAKVITFTHNLTHHNLGSPSYCSPERLSKAQVDPHSDLWALGVTLYEMVSGAPPYQAQNTRKLENLIQSRRPLRALPEDCPRPLQAIVAKSLASDIQRRYQSAEDFETDLRAFLNDLPCTADLDTQAFWDANATIQKYPAEAEAIHTRLNKPTILKWPKLQGGAGRNAVRALVLPLVAGFLVGLIVLMPLIHSYRFHQASSPLRGRKDYAHGSGALLSSDWDLYQQLKERNRFLKQLSPVPALEKPFRSNLVAAADSILDGFRNSSDQDLNDFDWPTAQICLQHALEIDPNDQEAKGKLALCNGYLNLRASSKLPNAATSVENFRKAASLLPRSPDPHLALARAYVYAYRNVAPALGELHHAEQLGYRLGPRELEQEADGYLYRTEWDLVRATNAIPEEGRSKWLAVAGEDIERARTLYEPIAGFSHVSASLENLYRFRNQQMKLQADGLPFALLRPVYSKPSLSLRPWR